jgi:hypothetical protein
MPEPREGGADFAAVASGAQLLLKARLFSLDRRKSCLPQSQMAQGNHMPQKREQTPRRRRPGLTLSPRALE